jgi:hypothetical protein
VLLRRGALDGIPYYYRKTPQDLRDDDEEVESYMKIQWKELEESCLAPHVDSGSKHNL